MSFVLRVDLESQRGISRGLPKLLDLLMKHDIKASFYLTMGGESNLLDIMKYNGRVSGVGERGIRVFSFFEKLRIALLPVDFVRRNISVLKRILDEGHELGIHGWKHRRWTRGLDKINIDSEVGLAMEKYTSLFGLKPRSFTSPAFRINKEVLSVLNNQGIKVISDLPGTHPSEVSGTEIINVPITVMGRENTPVIEDLVVRGYSDEKILDHLKKEMKKKKLFVMYIHCLYECVDKIELLDKILEHVKKEKIPTKTIEQVANENIASNK